MISITDAYDGSAQPQLYLLRVKDPTCEVLYYKKIVSYAIRCTENVGILIFFIAYNSFRFP